MKTDSVNSILTAHRDTLKALVRKANTSGQCIILLLIWNFILTLTVILLAIFK